MSNLLGRLRNHLLTPLPSPFDAANRCMNTTTLTHEVDQVSDAEASLTQRSFSTGNPRRTAGPSEEATPNHGKLEWRHMLSRGSQLNAAATDGYGESVCGNRLIFRINKHKSSGALRLARLFLFGESSSFSLRPLSFSLTRRGGAWRPSTTHGFACRVVTVVARTHAYTHACKRAGTGCL